MRRAPVLAAASLLASPLLAGAAAAQTTPAPRLYRPAHAARLHRQKSHHPDLAHRPRHRCREMAADCPGLLETRPHALRHCECYRHPARPGKRGKSRQQPGQPLPADDPISRFRDLPNPGHTGRLSVYVNGVRFNQPFGESRIWSILPDEAIASLAVEDGNPAFGLNALGGAINVQMKNGLTDPGGEVELSGGSFDQIQGNIEYGKQVGQHRRLCRCQRHP